MNPRALVAVVLVALVAGCTSDRSLGQPAIGSSDPAGVSAPTGLHGVPCEVFDPGSDPTGRSRPEPVPDGFVPVVAHRCIIVDATTNWRDGELRLEQVAHGNFDNLLKALREPSEARSPWPCPYPMPIGITLTDRAGATITPAWPTDYCGQPLSAVTTAVEVLPWQTVSQTPIPLPVDSPSTAGAGG
jgi:hypothetical protein